MLDDEYRRKLAVAGQLESCRRQIEVLGERLEAAPHWSPGHGLRAQCGEARRLLDDLEARLERKLVVALIGPSGAGKSTLLNALAKQDDLSPVSEDRPTTSQVVVFSRDTADAQPLVSALGADQVRAVSSPSAAALSNVILVDTPDTDSSKCPEHRPIVEQVVRNADILVCVFNSENPKRLDSIDYLSGLVSSFPHEALYVVLGHCDRRQPDELRKTILPDFETHIEQAWGRSPARIFSVSARSNLRSPNWPETAQPLHDHDEFQDLRSTIFDSLNRGGVAIDARIRHAEHIAGYVNDAVREQLEPCEPGLRKAEEEIRELGRSAVKAAIESVGSRGEDALWAVDLMLYQRLSQLCWGPIGWLVALWSRLLSVGTGIMNMLRHGNPVVQAIRAASSGRPGGSPGDASAGAASSQWVEEALRHFRAEIGRKWTDTTRQLLDLGFESTIFDPDLSVGDEPRLKERLAVSWTSALAAAVESASRALGAWPLQILLNLPVLAVAVMVAFESVTSFFARNYLAADYFRHALVTLLLVWLLPFIVFQLLVRMVGGARLLRRAAAAALQLASGDGMAATDNQLLEEIRVLRTLIPEGK